MLTGEMRQLPDWLTAQVQSLASPSPVELFRRLISTSLRPSSSEAVPENVIWPPGSTVIAGTANGGVISTGSWIVTLGATAVEVISQSRVALRRSACPVVSVAVALPRHVPSCGKVTS
jgi:hypothetical protein